MEPEEASGLPIDNVMMELSYRSILSLLIDASYYSAEIGCDFVDQKDVVDHYLRNGWQRRAAPSATFRPQVYSDVASESHGIGQDPYLHYLFDFVGEARLAEAFADLDAADVSRLRARFDGERYLRSNPDLDPAFDDPFIHYMVWGWREMRDPSAVFSTAFYLQHYPDVAGAGVNPFRHWVLHGIAEGRAGGYMPMSQADLWASLTDGQRAILMAMFGLSYYRSYLPTAAGLQLADRIATALAAGDDITPTFRTSRYIAVHSDISGSGQPPFLHYLFAVVGQTALHDLFVNRHPADIQATADAFDAAWYLYSYPDVEAAGHDAFIHYMTVGWKERRDPSRDFSTTAYLLRYPDIAEIGMNPFLHWIMFGKEEGRSGTSSASSFRKRDYTPSVTVVLINDAIDPLTAEAIAAVLGQTYADMEILLVGSPLSGTCRSVLDTNLLARPDVSLRHLPQDWPALTWASLGQAVDRVKSDLLWFVRGGAIHEHGYLARLLSSFADGSVQLGFGRQVDPDQVACSADKEALGRRMKGWDRHAPVPAALWFRERSRFDLLKTQPSFLWRRRALDGRVWQDADAYRLIGHWHLHLHMASGGQVAVVRDALMYVPSQPLTPAASFEENDVHADMTRLETEVRAFWPPQESGPNGQHILIVTHGIFAGGAENLPVQMANALVARGMLVSMLIFKIDVNAEMRATLDPGVSIYEADWVIEYGRDRFLRDIGCSLIHSHGVIGEMFFFRLSDEPLPVPYVATLHGSYEASTSIELPERFIARIVRNVDQFVYTADKNLAPLLRHGVREDLLVKMINAMPIDNVPFPRSRAELGIPDDAIVFTLVARGIPEKGWSTAIAAFDMLRKAHPDRSMHLCLVGEGDEPDRLKPLYSDDTGISFLGFQLRIHGLYRLSDVAIVPSRFAGESFPLCIIQALQVGVPIIATDVGEIASMLKVGGVVGGIVVPPDPVDARFETSIIGAMQDMMDDGRREGLALGAAALGREYDMETFINHYIALYGDVMQRFAMSRMKADQTGIANVA